MDEKLHRIGINVLSKDAPDTWYFARMMGEEIWLNKDDYEEIVHMVEFEETIVGRLTSKHKFVVE